MIDMMFTPFDLLLAVVALALLPLILLSYLFRGMVPRDSLFTRITVTIMDFLPLIDLWESLPGMISLLRIGAAPIGFLICTYSLMFIGMVIVDIAKRNFALMHFWTAIVGFIIRFLAHFTVRKQAIFPIFVTG